MTVYITTHDGRRHELHPDYNGHTVMNLITRQLNDNFWRRDDPLERDAPLVEGETGFDPWVWLRLAGGGTLCVFAHEALDLFIEDTNDLNEIGETGPATLQPFIGQEPRARRRYFEE